MVRTKGLVAGLTMTVILLGGAACGGSDGRDKAKSAPTPTTSEAVAGAPSGSQSASPQSQAAAARMVQEVMTQVQQSVTDANGVPRAASQQELEAMLREQMNQLLSQAAVKK